MPLPDDLAPDRGHMEPSTWSEVGFGSIVRDPNDRLWSIIGDKQGWIKEKMILTGEERVRHKPTGNVEVYVPSETECRVLLDAELGARLLRDVEDREHTIKRARRFRTPPVARTVTALRDHIDWFHGVNVDDVLRRHVGTKANPSDKARKKASLDELVIAHDEMHADPYMWPHVMAHHHGTETTP
jgi:hypothetical protein